MALSWARIGPREDERVLAGKVAGALWLTVSPMISVALLLPGTVTRHWLLLVAITAPTAAWGVACLFLIDWERVGTPLVFHVPSVLALPYIGVLVASTGVGRSPFTPTLLMLLAFCSYFFPQRIAISYIAACVVVQALPAIYDASALDSGVLAQTWIASLVFISVGGVIMIGKRELLALRDVAHELSLRDSLTGLANRRALTDLLERTERRSSRSTDSLGLVLIDLDNFKEANTLHGLPGGDRVLCAVADALLGVTRDEDVVIRLGGDEFAIVAFGVTRHGMKRFAERVLESVRDVGIDLDLSGFHLSASVGWAIAPEDADTVDELMTVADLALRAAKLRGKNSAQAPIDWVPESAT
jgi:diguanylate cyclase (GGDEF)-like protein